MIPFSGFPARRGVFFTSRNGNVPLQRFSLPVLLRSVFGNLTRRQESINVRAAPLIDVAVSNQLKPAQSYPPVRFLRTADIPDA
jgi:hypothetical protein